MICIFNMDELLPSGPPRLQRQDAQYVDTSDEEDDETINLEDYEDEDEEDEDDEDYETDFVDYNEDDDEDEEYIDEDMEDSEEDADSDYVEELEEDKCEPFKDLSDQVTPQRFRSACIFDGIRHRQLTPSSLNYYVSSNVFSDTVITESDHSTVRPRRRT